MTADQIQALIHTLVLEGLLALWLTRRWPQAARPAWSQVLMVTLAASMITHPVLYALVRWRPEMWSWYTRLAVWESVVVFVEAMIYMGGLRCGLRRGLLLSLACNCLSLFLPMVVRALW